MNILNINTTDIGGGAEKIAQTLHFGYRDGGHSSSLAVGSQLDICGDTISIPNDKCRPGYTRFVLSIVNSLAAYEGKCPGVGRLRRILTWLAHPVRSISISQGKEDFDYPGTRHILDCLSALPSIVHCHNLHGRYFDLRYLSELSNRVPVVITLHDEWLFTGHCACTLGCERWKTGCGECPDLSISPSIARDATAYNLSRKKAIFLNSRLYIATPSNWLMDKVRKSVLVPAIVSSKVIHNGVDLDIFKPACKTAARSAVGIDDKARVLLFTAYGVRRNKFKDYATLRNAIGLVAQRLPDVDLHFLAVGDTAEQEQIGRAIITFVPYSSDSLVVASYYQAADIYLHAANSDNFPTSVLEALACGTPAIATSVGGIPEQIVHGETGFLVPPKDPEGMADHICRLLSDDAKLRSMSSAAADYARLHFDKNRMIEEYLNWFSEIVDGQLR